MYTLYIDESGDPGKYKDNDIVKDGGSKYFVLGGIIVQNQMIDSINTRVKNLVHQYFNTSLLDGTFKLHYQVLNQGGPPYNRLSEDCRKCLADDVFDLIYDTQCTLLSVTIDLEAHYENYTDPVNPKTYSMLLILERFQDFLKSNTSNGSVVYERLNKVERKNLKKNIPILQELLKQKRYVNLENVEWDNIRSGDPTSEHVLELSDFFAYAAYVKYRSNCTKKNRWDSIKEKHYKLDDGEFTAGNVFIRKAVPEPPLDS